MLLFCVRNYVHFSFCLWLCNLWWVSSLTGTFTAVGLKKTNLFRFWIYINAIVQESTTHQSSLVFRPQPLRNILVLLFSGPKHTSEHAAGAQGQIPVGAAARELPVNYYTAHHQPTDGGHAAGQLRTMMPSSEITTQRPFSTEATVQLLTSTKINIKLICGVKMHWRGWV